MSAGLKVGRQVQGQGNGMFGPFLKMGWWSLRVNCCVVGPRANRFTHPLAQAQGWQEGGGY